MGKPSCDSFARERAAAVKGRAVSRIVAMLLLAAGLGAGGGSVARADPGPGVIPPLPVMPVIPAPPAMPQLSGSPADASPLPGGVAGPTGLDPAFLLLPAHDLEYVAPPTKTARVGDRFDVRVAALNADPNGMKIELPQGLEPLNDQGWEITVKAGAQPGALTLVVIPLKAGRLTIPSLLIKDSAEKAVARTNPFNVDVSSAIKPDDPKPTEAVALRPPVGLSFPWWLIVAAALLLLLAGAGILLALRHWSLKNRKLAAPEMPAAPALPDDVAALEELADVERQGLLKKGQYKNHYFRISEIMKKYVGARYRFDAIESTTREIIAVLEEKHLAQDQLIDKVESLFERLDRVKFTDHVPRPEDGTAILEDARKFVMTTRRPPPVVAHSPQPPAGANAI